MLSKRHGSYFSPCDVIPIRVTFSPHRTVESFKEKKAWAVIELELDSLVN